MVFSALARENRAEGLTGADPMKMGRLLGLDRAPEVGTLRARAATSVGQRCGDDLAAAMAAGHVAANEDLPGIFHLDRHGRAYHGRSRLPKPHSARARLTMPGTVETWVTDARGDGVTVCTGPPGAALSAELSRAMAKIRSLVGPDSKSTLVVDWVG